MTVPAPEAPDADDDLGLDPTEGDDTSDEPAPYAPPSEEEWKRTQAALAKANNEAKQFRLQARAKAGGDTPKPAPQGGDDPAAQEAAVAKLAEERADEVWKPRLVKYAARAALTAAGARTPDRLVRLVDFDAITFSEDGEVEGLEDQIDAFKADYPEMFKPARQAPGPRGVDASPRQPGSKPLSATERQLSRLGLR